MLAGIDRLFANLSQTIIGKEDAIELVLVALIGGGHALLEDVPGVGKTLLAKSLARSIDGRFQRIQCTPDLLPSDITGSNIWMPNSGEFDFLPGPVFTNVLLADEINRATPRTQSALLEVMEEQQVTLDGKSRTVPCPFFTIATQNPVEYQGTFPLPEAQMDRFMLSLSLGYPSETDELRMLQGLHSQTAVGDLSPCLSLTELQALQQQCRQVRIKDSLQRYLLAIVRSTRDDDEVTLGVSPRGAVSLHRAAQALALIKGRDFVIPDDIKQLAPHVLAHRIIPAAAQPAQAVVARLLSAIPVSEEAV